MLRHVTPAENIAHFAVRILQLRENQQVTSTDLMATMRPGISYAIARTCLSTAAVGCLRWRRRFCSTDGRVFHGREIAATKVRFSSNRSLAEVRFEREELGNAGFGCDLASIDFAAYAKACGAWGRLCTAPEDVHAAVRTLLSTRGPANLDAVVDANENLRCPRCGAVDEGTAARGPREAE
jgi:pyruvate dehydrogenase (quinone)